MWNSRHNKVKKGTKLQNIKALPWMNWEETTEGSLGMAVRLQQKRSRKKRSLKSQPPHHHGLFLKDKHFKSFAPRGIKSKQPIKNLEIF